MICTHSITVRVPHTGQDTRNQCLGPPSVQISGLCRHNESYEHKGASRQAEKVIKSQIVYQ